jgi:hypothetical protein
MSQEKRRSFSREFKLAVIARLRCRTMPFLPCASAFLWLRMDRLHAGSCRCIRISDWDLR